MGCCRWSRPGCGTRAVGMQGTRTKNVQVCVYVCVCVSEWVLPMVQTFENACDTGLCLCVCVSEWVLPVVQTFENACDADLCVFVCVCVCVSGCCRWSRPLEMPVT